MNPRTPQKVPSRHKKNEKKSKTSPIPKAILGKIVTPKACKIAYQDYENKVDNYLKVV